jgi:hypothetical protein
MGKWNDNEKKLCQAHCETDDTHRSDNNDQKSARWNKLVRDVAAVASDPSQPKGKKKAGTKAGEGPVKNRFRGRPKTPVPGGL